MFADVPVDKTVGVSVDLSVHISVGDRGLPWYAVGAAVGIAVEIAVDPAVEIAMAVPWASTVFRYLPRHSMEVRGKPVEARGRPAVARRVSAVVLGTPWTWP